MKAEEVIEALTAEPAEKLGMRETMEYLAAQRAAREAIREAFAIADRAREELAILEADVARGGYGWEPWEESRRALLQRIIGEE